MRTNTSTTRAGYSNQTPPAACCRRRQVTQFVCEAHRLPVCVRGVLMVRDEFTTRSRTSFATLNLLTHKAATQPEESPIRAAFSTIQTSRTRPHLPTLRSDCSGWPCKRNETPSLSTNSTAFSPITIAQDLQRLEIFSNPDDDDDFARATSPVQAFPFPRWCG